MDPRPRPGFCLLSTSKHVHKAIKQINTSTDKSILMMIAFIVGQLNQPAACSLYLIYITYGNLIYWNRIYAHSLSRHYLKHTVCVCTHLRHNNLMFAHNFTIKNFYRN